MRTILIDLSQDRQDAVHCFGGFEGEHNATKLSVVLPERMKGNSDGEYRFVFETAKKEVIFSAPMREEEGILSVELVKKLTTAPRLTVYVASYRYEDSNPVQIAKSGQIILTIKNPEDGEISEWNSDGGCVPGIVMEESVLPDSENPVKSRALYKALEEKIPLSRITEQLRDASQAGEKLPTEKAVAKRLEDFVAKEDFEEDVLAVGDEVYTEKSDFDSFCSEMKNGAASAISATREGNPLRLEDVSPIEHEIAVTLSRVGASVTVHGKNLLPYPYEGIEESGTVSVSGVTYVDQGDGSILMYGMSGEDSRVLLAGPQKIQLIDGAIYALSGGRESWYGLRLVYTDENGNDCSILSGSSVVWSDRYTLKGVYIQCDPKRCFLNDIIRPMVELGEQITEYEEPRGPMTFVSAEGGVVSGITSIFPVMTLIADKGTEISVTYNQDTGKVFRQMVKTAKVDADGNLMVTLADGSEINAGYVVGPKGEKGEKGDRGEQGIQGEKGEKGDSASDFLLLGNAIKNSAAGNPLFLDDVSSLEHEMTVKVDVGGATVKKHGKNLFTTQGREVIDCAGKAFPTLEENKIYLNISRNGYVCPTTSIPVVYVNADECDFSNPRKTSVVSKQAGYGAGFAFKVKGGEVYTIRMATNSEAAALGFGFYKDGKTLISHTSSESSATLFKTVTVPSDAEIMLLCLTCSENTVGAYTTYEFEDVQLEIGGTATEYEEYKEPVTYTADENGNVEGVTSYYPTTTLVADNGATITAEYSIDTKKYIDKKFAELQALILEV